MPTTKLYPQTTDTFNASEIAVTNGVKSDNIPTSAWNSSGLILRFIDSPYTDYGAKGLSATVAEGAVTITDGKAVFNGSSALYVPTSLSMFGASPSVFVGVAQFNQTVGATGDQTVFHIAGNGCKSRLLLSGGYIYAQVFFADGSNQYIRFTYSQGTDYTVSYKVTNNSDGTVTTKVWSGGALVNQATWTKTPYASTLANSIGCEPNLVQNFLGTMDFVAFYGGTLTDDECLALSSVGPTKYPTIALLDMNQDVTDPQLTKFVSFGYEKHGDGSLLFRVSDDDGAEWDAWDGLTWSSGGSGYNSGTTLNDYLEEYPATNQQLRVRVAHISDGWQQVGLDYVQVGINLNTAPNIIAGPSSIVKKGAVVYPALGVYFSDPDDNITRCFYSLAGGAEVEVFQGIYATLLEALQAISFDSTSWSIGTKSITFIVEDALGARGQDTTEIFIVENDTQVISDIYSLLQSVSSNVDSIKTQTDTLPDVKTETDKIQSVKTQTDTLPSIKTETDKIATVLTDIAGVDTAVGATFDSVSLVKTETDKIVSIKAETDKIAQVKTETDKIPALQTSVGEIDVLLDLIAAAQATDHSLLDQVHSRFYGARVTYNTSVGEYSIYDKSNNLIARFKTYDENMNPSGLRVLNVVKQ